MTRSLLLTFTLLLSLCACGEDDVSPAAPLPWRDVARERGLEFSVDRGSVEDWFMPESIAAGCALFDANGDGRLDVYVVSGWRDAEGRVDAEKGRNRLWLQRADGTFEDVSRSSGMDDGGYGMGVAVGDVDNDGDLDVYITNWGPDRLYRNEGGGRFSDVTSASGIENDAWGASAGFCDLDDDGLLDLFVTNYVDYDPDRHVGRDNAGRPEYMGPESLEGVPDRLFRGVGGGRFEDVSDAAGISRGAGRGLGVAFLDLDGDHRLDVYVANDREANHAWIARGDGTFQERALPLRLAVNERGAPEASMGIAVGDGDGDGLLDLFLTHFLTETHTLYRQERRGSWRDVTSEVGLGASTRNDTGWGCAFVDLEHDGDPDLVWINGRVLRGPAVASGRVPKFWRPYAQRDRVFKNHGGTYEEVFMPPLTELEENGRGLAVGDVDGDGDMDCLVSTANGTIRLFLNEIPQKGRWLQVRVRDPKLGRDVEGAVVTLHREAGDRVAVCSRTGSYLSSGPPVAHFGLGSDPSPGRLSVRWPGGETEDFGTTEVDRRLILERGQGR